MNYLPSPYDRSALERLTVTDSALVAGLRSHVRRDALHSQPERLRRDECLALLCGEALPELALASRSEAGDAGRMLADAIAMIAGAQKQPLDESAVREIAHDETVKAMGNGAFPVDRVKEICGEMLASVAPRVVRVDVACAGVVRSVENQHWLFPVAAAVVGANIPLYLCGPAGGGKSTLAHSIANALGLPFEFTPFGPGMSKSDLFGYRDAGGVFRDTALVRTYRDGGLWLADELDRADAPVLTLFNNPLANGHMATPGGMLARSENWRIVAGANTAGTGASELYTAAMELDASTLDRFFFLGFPYDESLEEFAALGAAVTAPRVCDLTSGGMVSPAQWLAGVRAARAECERLQMRHTISPRAAIYGARLCGSLGLDWLIPGLITRGLPTGEAETLAAAFKMGAR